MVGGRPVSMPCSVGDSVVHGLLSCWLVGYFFLLLVFVVFLFVGWDVVVVVAVVRVVISCIFVLVVFSGFCFCRVFLVFGNIMSKGLGRPWERKCRRGAPSSLEPPSPPLGPPAPKPSEAFMAGLLAEGHIEFLRRKGRYSIQSKNRFKMLPKWVASWQSDGWLVGRAKKKPFTGALERAL